MRFKWTGTSPTQIILDGGTRDIIDGGWWEVFQILANMLVATGTPIPPEFLRTTPGRGIKLSNGQVLNTNLCYDDVIPRIRRLAELHGKLCVVKWRHTKGGSSGTLVLFEQEAQAEIQDPVPPSVVKSKIVIVMFDSDTVRNDPALVQATLQSIIGL